MLRENPTFTWPVFQFTFLFLFGLLSATFSSAAIAREAHSLEVLKVLPLSGWTIACGKYWIHWLVLFSFLGILELVAALLLNWSIAYFIYGWIIVGMMMAGSSAIGVWFSAIGAKYNPNNPQNRLETGTSFLLMFANLIYLLLISVPVAFLVIPLESLDFLEIELLHKLLDFKQSAGSLATVGAFLICLLISFCTAWLSLRACGKAVDRGVSITFEEKR